MRRFGLSVTSPINHKFYLKTACDGFILAGFDRTPSIRCAASYHRCDVVNKSALLEDDKIYEAIYKIKLVRPYAAIAGWTTVGSRESHF